MTSQALRRSPGSVLLLVLVAGLASGAADGVKVTTDRTVDASSLESIVADVVRLSGATTNDQKAIALYDWLHQVVFHHAYPNERAPRSVGPLKVINVYGWGLCGGEHTVLKALYETAGWQVRYRGWSDPGHTTIEAHYDGRWHYLDVFLKAWFLTKDRATIASQDDINADPSIVLDGLKDGRVPPHSFLACGDEVAGIVSGCASSRPEAPSRPSDGWAAVTGRDQGYSPLLTLRSGASLDLEWASRPGMMVADGTTGRHTCPAYKDSRGDARLGPILEHYGARSYANGRFAYAPDFAKPADLADITVHGAKPVGGTLVATGAGSALFKLDLPYAYASATLAVAFAGGDGTIAVSTDGGGTWTPTAAGDIGALVRQQYAVWVRVTFPATLERLAVEAVVEHNRAALPFLHQGTNVVTVAAAQALPPGTALVVTYVYQEATAPAGRRRFDGSQLTYGEIRTVTRELRTLPASFAIEVGGNTPPRMLAIGRSLQAR